MSWKVLLCTNRRARGRFALFQHTIFTNFSRGPSVCAKGPCALHRRPGRGSAPSAPPDRRGAPGVRASGEAWGAKRGVNMSEPESRSLSYQNNNPILPYQKQQIHSIRVLFSHESSMLIGFREQCWTSCWRASIDGAGHTSAV